MLSIRWLAACFESCLRQFQNQFKNHQGIKYYLKSGDSVLSFASILNLWRDNRSFRQFFSQILADAPFSAYRWETPPITLRTLDRPFEFVLLDTEWFAHRPTDDSTFCEHFTEDDSDGGVVRFPNLGGDATLIVPSPRSNNLAYGHLAAFVSQCAECSS